MQLFLDPSPSGATVHRWTSAPERGERWRGRGGPANEVVLGTEGVQVLLGPGRRQPRTHKGTGRLSRLPPPPGVGESGGGGWLGRRGGRTCWRGGGTGAWSRPPGTPCGRCRSSTSPLQMRAGGHEYGLGASRSLQQAARGRGSHLLSPMVPSGAVPLDASEPVRGGARPGQSRGGGTGVEGLGARDVVHHQRRDSRLVVHLSQGGRGGCGQRAGAWHPSTPPPNPGVFKREVEGRPDGLGTARLRPTWGFPPFKRGARTGSNRRTVSPHQMSCVWCGRGWEGGAHPGHLPVALLPCGEETGEGAGGWGRRASVPHPRVGGHTPRAGGDGRDLRCPRSGG